ncbi:hypothetical protein ACOSP7_022139 [Xanthoceras sorbifolium]|uniref:Uncharacterized protein n=1 Tax=Xanthoceras sorbifolium TaxID=99658 RepID=A0ABQ8HNN6_9ROSI|nr:hypothetical protein JRO89_XS08G0050800 [Xanthoceras sorbifolium]
METKLSPPLLLLIVLLLLPSITTARHLDHELSLAITSLRAHGHNLFSNFESHLFFPLRLLSSSNSTLTFFSPPDSLLFSSSDSVLRFVSPVRLTASRLKVLSSGTCVNTLLPHHHLLIERTTVLLHGIVSDSVTVDGMMLSLPDLFIGSNVAVHGLDEILVGGFESKVLTIEKLVTPYISSWIETGLSRSKNQTNWREIVINETGILNLS